VKQEKGRSGAAGLLFAWRVPFLLCTVFVASLLVFALPGCNGTTREAIVSGETTGPQIPGGPPPSQRRGVNQITPDVFFPGDSVELHGHGLPTDPGDVQILFTRAGEPLSNGIPGFPYRLTSNLISLIVPSGVSSGLVNVLVREGEQFVTLQPKTTTVGPQLIGYVVPDPPRVPGVIEGDPIRGPIPETVIVYGLNIDTSVISATVELMNLNRQTSERFPEVAIEPQDRGITVPGVSDPAIRGVRITLPKELGQKLDQDSIVRYVRISVRAGPLQSNAVEIPAIRAGAQFGDFGYPWPAFVSGVWVTPGVHGNLLELYYTVFQPLVQLKWTPVVEWTPDNGQTWQAVNGVVAADPDAGDPLDFRTELIIAGSGVQKPEKPCFAGPGTTYRIYINVREAWPPETLDPMAQAGSVRLRIRMRSDPVSHGESQQAIQGRIEGNNMQFPRAAIALRDEPDTDPPEPLRGGVIVETFGNKTRALDRDPYTKLDSTGQWGVGDPKVATGPSLTVPITGSGTEELILEEGKDYLFDTDVGLLYQFPDDSSDDFIAQVRSEIGIDPTRRQGTQLTLVWDENQNPGAGAGELHVSQLVVPEGTRLFARGRKPFVVRVSGAAGGLAAVIAGEINVDGLPGSDGTADSDSGDAAATPGRGGVGGPGGGHGGDGGLVRVTFTGISVAVQTALPAQPGEWGGGAGQTMAYLLPQQQGQATTARCFVYGGPGGGGGFGTPGLMGRPGTRMDGTNNWQGSGNVWSQLGDIYRVSGIGGPVRGSEDLLPLIGGSGGGGGGGFLARTPIAGTTGEVRIFGVGGGGGGGGGGAFRLVASGTIKISGRISARGGIGGVGRGKPLESGGTRRDRGEWGGACGGGGSGGAILIQTTESLVFEDGAVLDVSGGKGGRPGTTQDPRYLNSPRYPLGGDGGAGRIRLEAGRGVNLPRSIDLTGVAPAPSEEGPTTVGPILKPVDGGTGVHGVLDLGEITAQANEPVVYISAEEGAVYYFDTDGARVDVVGTGQPGAEFHFAALYIPNGTTLKGVGNAPIVIRVQGKAVLEGTIDVAGQDGGPVTVTPDGRLVPGQGGMAGPGGGNGGFGGFGSYNSETGQWDVVDGQDGQMPPSFPKTDYGFYVPGEPWSEREPLTLVTPARGGLSLTPDRCPGDCTGYESHAGAGGGGGGFGTDGGAGTDTPGPLLTNGAGGTEYGRHWFLGVDLEGGVLYGGAGGAGGGASTNRVAPDDDFAVPGTGGGGGGGCLVLAVGGDLTIGGTGIIDARGGKAYLPVNTGGAGGGGAGGAVLIRVNGNFEVQPGAVITALGGKANQDPGINYPPPYVLSTLETGGDGAPGRIRIEYPGAGLTTQTGVEVTILPEGTVPSVGTAFNGNETISWVWSKPIPLAGGAGSGLMLIDGYVDVNRIVVDLLRTNFSSNIVRWSVLVDGGEAACASRAAPDRLFGPMSDLRGLQAVGLKPSYMRFLIAFVGSARTGEVPAIDTIRIPWERVDYMPPPPPPEEGQ